LDVEAAAGGEVIANLVQPSIPKRLRITFIDSGVEISAFQVDVVGTDYDDAAATDQFLFAGGLVQTGTTVFKTVTSITLTSITETGATAKTLDVDWDGNCESNPHALNDGGKYNIFAYGTWDTATLKIQISPDNGTTWIDYASLSYTANAAATFDAAPGALVRAHLASVGATTSLTALLL
jgi:hypothetical protein